jgi:hypothetical protein
LFRGIKTIGTRAFLNSASADVDLGMLQPGDSLTYVYQLSAQGTTHGGEHGFLAFLGDPFGQDIISGNLVLSVGSASVPEPATATLCVIGMVCIVVVLGVRRARIVA